MYTAFLFIKEGRSGQDIVWWVEMRSTEKDNHIKSKFEVSIAMHFRFFVIF